MTFARSAVIGGGQMGAGIAEVMLRAGIEVVLVERSATTAAEAAARIEASVRRAAQRGRFDLGQIEPTLGRLRVTRDLEAVADRDLVIEAATEDETTKLDLFTRLGAILVDDDAVLASNTSSIPIARLGAASGRPENVLGVHFFNPAPVMRLVELIPSLRTAAQTTDRVRAFITGQLGKHPIDATDRAGFVVNSLLVPYLLASIRMYESGHASASDIDEGMRLGCGHPMGPLELADLIGLDTVSAIGESLYDEFKEPLYAPPPLLGRMVEAGHLGRKTSRGFHVY